MKSIRRFVYAALLLASAFSFAPTHASAQEAAGNFTLTHEVRWQAAKVPAGKYRFTMGADGPSQVLTLRNNGTGASFVFLVADTEDSQPSDSSSIIVRCRSSDCFVTAMQLPESRMTLHFAVPAETREVARATLPPTATTTP